MQRKSKVQLTGYVFVPLHIIAGFCLFRYFPTQLLSTFHYSSFIFPIFFLAFFFTSSESYRLNFFAHSKTKPKFSVFTWLCLLAFIEIGFVSLLLVQDQLHWIGMVGLASLNHFMPLLYSSLTPHLGGNWALFPWTLFAVIAASLAIITVKASSIEPWGLQFFPRSRTFKGNIIRRILNAHILIANRIFILAAIVVTNLFCAQLIYHSSIAINSLIHSMFISGVLLIVLFGQSVKRLILSLERKQFRQGILLILLGLIIALVTLFSCMIIESVAKHSHSQLMQLFLRSFPLPTSSLDPFFHMSHWIFWIFGLPLFCSLCIRISEGRTIRQMIGAVISFPLLAIGAFHLLKHHGISLHLQSQVWVYAPITISLIGLISLCSMKGLHHYLRSGYAPLKENQKNRRVFFEPLMMASIGLVALELLLPQRGFVWVFTMGPIYGCWLLYLLVPLFTLLKRYRFAMKKK